MIGWAARDSTIVNPARRAAAVLNPSSACVSLQPASETRMNAYTSEVVPAEQGGAGEEQDAGGEGAAAADDVSDAPAEQQQTAEGERVGVEDPGQAGAAEAEVLLDVRQRYVDDGGIDADHQVGGDDDE